MGSASELDYHCLLAKDLGLINPTDYDSLAVSTAELKRMLNVLIKKLRAKS
jgi:four helix bundle protein